MRRVCMLVFFFFFKQKTAYEMRISDWNSDVCSSDLAKPIEEVHGDHLRKELPEEPLILPGSQLAGADMELKEMRAVMQDGKPVAILKIGRASCRERVCQYV